MHRLDLLGPVTLRRAGQPVALPTHKVAALLVLLALGGPAHRARVADWLWPDGDDATAHAALPAAAAVRDLQEQRDQEHAVLCHAELALAEADPAAALRWLDDWPAPEAHAEVSARRTLARLQAMRVLQEHDLAARRRAVDGGPASARTAAEPAAEPRTSLADVEAAAQAAADRPRTPRPTVLELLAALADTEAPAAAPPPSGDASGASAARAPCPHRQAFETLRAALCDSLAAHPLQRDGLLRRWP